MMTQNLPQDILLDFIKGFKSIVLSTISQDNEPLASYAPCVVEDQSVYIIISEAAPHFHNMKFNGLAGALMVEDEKDASSIFFRKRLSLKCHATFIDPKTMQTSFKVVHGDMVDMLLDKLDFAIVKLEVTSGTFVIGAGQAYKMNASFELIDQDRGAKDRGHNK
jgi:putative heme iron utilization protein